MIRVTIIINSVEQPTWMETVTRVVINVFWLGIRSVLLPIWLMAGRFYHIAIYTVNILYVIS